LLEIVRDGNDVLFAEVMSGDDHLLALPIALAKHLNLNADVVTVLPAQVRYAGNGLALAVWPVAALACLDDAPTGFLLRRFLRGKGRTSMPSMV
jgi:hypothetical protein